MGDANFEGSCYRNKGHCLCPLPRLSACFYSYPADTPAWTQELSTNLHQGVPAFQDPELLLEKDSFIVLAQIHNCSRFHLPQARQVLCPHWKAMREFHVEITKEVIDSRCQLGGSEFRFLESYASGDAEIFYSCSETTRTGVQPFIQTAVQTQDPILYVFLASAISPGSFTINPVNPNGAHPEDPIPLPWYFTEEAAVWALTRLGNKGYNLIHERIAYGKNQLTPLGSTTARVLLYMDLDFYMSLLVASDTPTNTIQLGWTLVAAIGASSGEPVLQLKDGEVNKPKKYSQRQDQQASRSLNNERVMISFDHLKALGVLTMGTANMTKEQIEAVETDPAFKGVGDTFSDAAFVLLRMKQERAPVPKPSGAQPFEYGAWVDTSEASNEPRSMLDCFQRVSRVLGWNDPEIHCLLSEASENGEDTAEIHQQCGEWLHHFGGLWLDVYMYNFAFVKVKKTIQEETGNSRTFIKAIDNVHFTAHDFFCSGLEVHLGPKSTIHLSQCHMRYGFDEGFYITYTTIREVANKMWQISGINCVNHVALKAFKKRIFGVAHWVGEYSDVLLSTYKNPEWP